MKRRVSFAAAVAELTTTNTTSSIKNFIVRIGDEHRT